MKKLILVFAILPFLFTSCVGKKKLADLESQLTELQASSSSALSKSKADLSDCQSLTASLQGELKKRDSDLEAKNGQLKTLQEQLDYFKKTNTNLLDRLSDLSVINKSAKLSLLKSST